MEYYTPLFFLEVSSIQPSDFCQKVNLCEQMALLSTQVKEDSCQLCHQAVSEVLKKLKDPETQVSGIITHFFFAFLISNVIYYIRVAFSANETEKLANAISPIFVSKLYTKIG